MPNVNINPGGGGSVYNPYSDQSPTGTTTPQAPVSAANILRSDTLTSSLTGQAGQTQAPVKPYTAQLGTPQLAQPQDPSPVYSTDPKTGLPVLNANLSNQPIIKPQNEKDISFGNNFNNLLNQAATDQNLSSEDTALIRYAYYHPDSDIVPQNLKELAKTLISQATNQVQQEYEDPSFQSQPDVASFDNNVNDLYQQDFNAALKNYAEKNGLSSDDVAKLIYAQDHPDAPVDPKLAAILKEVNTEVLGDLHQEYGLPSSLEFKPDTAFFDAQINENFGANFDSLLSAYADANGLSAGDQETIKFAFMHPEADIPAKDGLDYKQVASELGAQASAQTSKADGLPVGVSPSPPTKTYDQMLTGGYIFNARDAMAADSGMSSLSADDQNTVFLLVTGQLDMNDPSIPDALKSKASAIKKAALAKLQAQYGIPNGQFTPDPASMAGATLAVPANLKTMDGILSTQGKMLKGLTDTLNKMPESPNKANYANYLKAIADAMADLRNVLYLVQQKDSNLSQEMSKWSLDSSQNRNALSNAQRDENLKKMRDHPKPKGGVLGAIMKFFQKLGPVFGAIMAFAMMGPVGLALSVLDTKLGIFAKMINGLADVIGNLIHNERIKEGIKTAIKVMTMATFFMAMGPMAGAAIVTFGPQMIAESGVCENIVASCGGSPDLAKKIGMYMSMAIGAAIALSTMLVPIPGPNLAAISAGAVSVLRQVAQAVETVSELAANMIRQLASLIEKLPTAIESLQSQISEIANTVQQFIEKFVKDFAAKLNGALSKALKYPGEASEALSGVLDKMQTVADTLKGVANKVADTLPSLSEKSSERLDKIGSYLSKLPESAWDELVSTATDPMAIASTLETVGQVQGAISNIKIADWKHKIAALETLIAQLEGTIDLLDAMIKNLRKVLDNLLSGLPPVGQQINDINTQVNTLYQKATESQTQLFNA